ncbi:UNVERIFIED_CONTAM: aldose 1-epimerase family protein [Streptococcus canis]|uniref:Aldose 1-epimerase 1 n=1 Tax=Streptococcus canis FSL Z3-227 TaxID=482234 RepID=A0AAV3FU78_STRCB|nr:aldose 1-epimerase family protein [Streptococcus canis]EIQ82507.1 aldose 1-epimerase 1 [Streptococcus canis FSL Z3-227]MDV5988856.1 aldose 1-epimerase family protein [Streptococcus canis]MDV5994057.1 aldose 1-epimerase family protein [Streptococcus canis]MDV6001765.1 aldose 1-epimerase family protein [Streptococcus canis]MDV6023542.1 aldose 1-epimerase family protein [Streptococcus canis]
MVYSLTNDELSLQFKALGGEMSSIKDKDGIEYLWQGDSTYWSGQAPVLFPICGSLRDNQTVYGNNAAGIKQGFMPRHGLVRKEVFQLESQTDSEIIFALTSSEDMYQKFPYRFTLRAIYHLIGKTIRVTYEVTNLEEQATMPFTIGAHPAFNCPLFANETYEDYYLSFEKAEDESIPKVFADTGLIDLEERTPFFKGDTRLDLTYDLFKDDTLLLDRLASKTISLCSAKHSKGLVINLLDFPFLVLWSTNNKGPFIALEPWLGLSTLTNESNYFEDKINTQFLAPQQAKRYAYELRVL